MLYTAVPRRALFIAAHPDDIEFVTAGTAARWSSGGCKVRYVLVTRGDAGSHDPGADREELARVRMAEQRAAARAVGVEDVTFLGYPDGMVEDTMALRRDLVREIRRFRPDVLVCFDPRPIFVREDYVNHPDHRAVGLAALAAACPTAAMPLIFPELREEGLEAHRVPEILAATPLSPNCFVDISATLESKLAALRCHRSQYRPDWNPESLILDWARENGMAAGVPYAEAYHRIRWRNS
jgi:LmbE family N-acetylglucosaminyl deacetylase